MSEYVCLECDRNFSETTAYFSHMDFAYGVPQAVTYSGCPYCKSEYYKEFSEDEYYEELE